MRSRSALAPALLLALAAGDAARAAARADLPLGGVLVAALAPDAAGSASTAPSDPAGRAAAAHGALLLVRPGAEPDGARRLLRLSLLPTPRLEVVADGLAGGLKALAAIDLGAGPELVAGELGRLISLGPLAAPTGAGRVLLDHPGFDLRSLAPGRLRVGVEAELAAAEAGALRLWHGDGRGGLALVREAALPVEVVRLPAGLRLSSPPVAAAHAADGARLWIAGPEPVGRTRLRAAVIAAAGGEPQPVWAALPGAEQVERSWPAAFDGAPALVVRTQGAAALDLLERQRLRVLPLAADRTRAGGAPTLAVELDSRRWHETEVVVTDADGDGRDDLVAAYPEGLGGGDLVAQVWRGRGAASFEPRAQRTDVDAPPASWKLLADADGAGRPGLLLAWADRAVLRLELRLVARAGRGALEREPALAARVPVVARGETTVTLGVGSGGGDAEVAREDGGVTLLGVAELDGRPGVEALVTLAGADGGERLLVLGR